MLVDCIESHDMLRRYRDVFQVRLARGKNSVADLQAEGTYAGRCSRYFDE
jgi:hypothetical protein